MKIVQRYEAADGTVFDALGACAAHERLMAEVAALMALLPAVDLRGTECFQHDADQVRLVQRALVGLYERDHPQMRDHHTEWARTTEEAAGHSLVGRYMSDLGGPLERAWHRLERIDQRFREWEQPYYALKSDKERAA